MRTAIFLVLFSFSGVAHGQTALAVLPFKDLDHTTNSSRWEYALPLLLKLQLAQIPQVRVLGDDWIEFAADDSVQYAYRKADDKRGSAQELMRKVGQILEADWLVWGSYRQAGGTWTVNGWAMNIHSGQYSVTLSSSSPDLFAALCRVRELLVKVLDIHPSPQTEARLDQPLTRSSLALDQLASAFADVYGGRPLASLEHKLRGVLAIDPSFTLARAILGRTLLVEGKLSEAAEQSERAICEQPELASAHYILGTVYLERAGRAKDNGTEDPESERLAEREFSVVRRVAPDQPEALLSLAQLARMKGDNQQAMSLLEIANELVFYDARVHEEMAMIYIQSGDREQALRELRMAEGCDNGTEYQSSIALAQICEALHLTQKAVHYYEGLMPGAESIGADESAGGGISQHIRALKERLAPRFVPANPPDSFTSGGLRAAIRQRLGKVKGELPENPFAETPEMTSWARSIIGTNADAMAKAKLLFEAMTHRIDGSQITGQRTAEEAFKDWGNPQADFSCEDYTFLWVSLARAVGLPAYFVQVSRYATGVPAFHACAGVFIRDKALLVDPAQDWFGPVHQEYEFESDLEATALFWSQRRDLAARLDAIKLAPELPVVHFMLALTYASEGQMSQAQEEFNAGLALPRKIWWAPYVEATIELSLGNPQGAVADLKKCLALAPDFPKLYYLLGRAYERAGDLKRAREEYRAYVVQADRPDALVDARAQISELDAKLENTTPSTAEPSEPSRIPPAADSGKGGQKAEPSS